MGERESCLRPDSWEVREVDLEPSTSEKEHESKQTNWSEIQATCRLGLFRGDFTSRSYPFLHQRWPATATAPWDTSGGRCVQERAGEGRGGEVKLGTCYRPSPICGNQACISVAQNALGSPHASVVVLCTTLQRYQNDSHPCSCYILFWWRHAAWSQH